MAVCVTCGATPSGTFNDGSPRFSCGPHPPVRGDPTPPRETSFHLTDAEWATIVDCAERKQRSGKAGKRDRFAGGRELRSDIVGAAGEFVVSKWVGIPFECHVRPDKAEGDVLGVEVKTAVRDYGLVVHENDPDYRPIILVVGDERSYRIAGWIRAGDGKRTEYWKDPGGRRPAWFVPAKATRPVDELYEPMRLRARQRGLIE